MIGQFDIRAAEISVALNQKIYRISKNALALPATKIIRHNNHVNYYIKP